MKKCQGCGCSNDDNNERCRNCGTRIESQQESALQDKTKFDNVISTSQKWRYWFGAWFLVLLITLLINPKSIIAAPFFPIGLLAWFPHGEETAITAWMTGAWGIGWGLYLLLSVTMFTTRKGGVFLFIYVIFFVLLILNVVGCQRVIEAANGIH